MKNKLVDLNNHLFAEIERLSDEDLKGEELDQEITRAKAVCGVAVQIISGGQLALNASKAVNDGIIRRAPKLLGMEEYEEV